MKDRILIKHDLAENWAKAVNFIPLSGELIIYDGVVEDGKYSKFPKFKLGDGITKINDLPFINFNEDSEKKNYTEGNVLVINS